MAIAPRNQSRRQGDVNLLLPPPRPPAQRLEGVLDQLQRDWKGDGHLAALWQAWPRIAGAQLAQHCRPLRLQGRRLTVGASHPQWLQALEALAADGLVTLSRQGDRGALRVTASGRWLIRTIAAVFDPQQRRCASGSRLV